MIWESWSIVESTQHLHQIPECTCVFVYHGVSDCEHSHSMGYVCVKSVLISSSSAFLVVWIADSIRQSSTMYLSSMQVKIERQKLRISESIAIEEGKLIRFSSSLERQHSSCFKMELGKGKCVYVFVWISSAGCPSHILSKSQCSRILEKESWRMHERYVRVTRLR